MAADFRYLAKWLVFGLVTIGAFLALTPVVLAAPGSLAAKAVVAALVMFGGICAYILIACGVPALDLREIGNPGARYAPWLITAATVALPLYLVASLVWAWHAGSPLSFDRIVAYGGLLILSGTTAYQQRFGHQRDGEPATVRQIRAARAQTSSAAYERAMRPIRIRGFACLTLFAGALVSMVVLTPRLGLGVSVLIAFAVFTGAVVIVHRLTGV